LAETGLAIRDGDKTRSRKAEKRRKKIDADLEDPMRLLFRAMKIKYPIEGACYSGLPRERERADAETYRFELAGQSIESQS
jgi:hypothetical protein